MRLAGFSGGIVNEGVGKRRSVLGDIEVIGIEIGEGIEGGGLLAGDPERIENMNLAEAVARASGDPGVFAFGIDADHGAIGGQQVRNDRADALAGARRRHGE